MKGADEGSLEGSDWVPTVISSQIQCHDTSNLSLSTKAVAETGPKHSLKPKPLDP